MASLLAKDPTLFEKWKSIYKQYHPKDIVFANDMIKEIKHQQTEYYKNKKYCPVNNCWENVIVTKININLKRKKKITY